MTVDGMVISSMSFGSADDYEKSASRCAELGRIAQQLILKTNFGDLDTLVLEGELGFLIVLPILDKAFLAVLARKQAKLGLVILDMRGAIDGSFGSGLASEPIFIPRPPRSNTSHARPE